MTTQPESHIGRIEMIIGPMFSGKSSELLRRLRRHKIAGQKCLLVKSSLDNRYSEDRVCTHDGVTSSETVLNVGKLSGLVSACVQARTDVVAVDEGQFFEDLVQSCTSMADAGIIVIVAALDATFERVAFHSVVSLIPVAESITKLTAVCANCCLDASFTHLKDKKRKPAGGSSVMVGGGDLYVPLCRKCFNSKYT